MRILTADNTTYEMTEYPENVDDMRFCVLDNSNPQDPDYYFIPMIFLESFNDPALVMKIGNRIIRMPYNWQILIGESEFGDLELIPLTGINDRDFNAFTCNPLAESMPRFEPIEIVDVYQDVKWFFPKLKPGQLLAVPLSTGPKASCAFFVREISRTSEIVDVSKIW